MANETYNNLLSEIAKAIREQSHDFNIFEMLGQSARELTHSAFIAQLLNPQGPHEKGSTFLELFLKTITLDEHFDIEGVEVEIEKDCGIKAGEGSSARGGRIDIFIKNSKGQIIVIENKIYASDQKDQLQRYRNSTGHNSIILYLTLDGHLAVDTPKSVKYHRISYRKEITEWLTKCLKESIDNPSLHNVISQYMTTIRNLTTDQEVMKIIQSSANNLKASLQIARLADKARNNMKKLFLEDIAEHLNLHDKEVREVGKEWQLQTENCQWCIEHNLFIRFLNPTANRIEDSDKNWVYVYFRPNETINFHELNYPASLWCDNTELFWETFASTISSITNRYGLK